MNKVKNMLCIVLALAMMLIPMSVCAAPADGYDVALNLSADNTTVAPGDTITLSLTVDVADWENSWGLPCFYLMYNDAIFAPASDFKTNREALRAPMGDFGEYVVEDTGVNNTITSSNYTAVSKKFEAAGESATDYTGGVMMTFKVDTDAGYSTLTGIQYTDADTVQVEFYLNVAEDAALGTYKVGLPHAAYDAGKAYFSNCTTGKSVRVAASAIDTSNAFVEITVANPATPLTVSHLKDQIRFDTNADGTYKGTFDYRVIASIDLGDAKEADLKMAGFVFNKGEGATIDAAKALADVKAKYADANATTNYSMTTKAYISTSFKDNGTDVPYAMSCVVNNVPDAEKGNTIATVGYVVYELNGETCYALYDVEAVQFSGLYNTYYSQQFGA